MTRKARAVYRATCAAGACALRPAPSLRAPHSRPCLCLGLAGLGVGLRAQLSLAGWPQTGELVRTSPPRARQDPAPGPAAIKSGCREQGSLRSFLEPGPGCHTGKDLRVDAHPRVLWETCLSHTVER